jgi:hypothetical protein
MTTPTSSKPRSVRPQLTRAHLANGAGADQAYRLSRVQAEGWNAAKRAASKAPDISDSAKIDSLNPYPADPERARWKAGFAYALRS